MPELEPVWCVKEKRGPWHGTANGCAYDKADTIIGTVCRSDVYRESTMLDEQHRLPECEHCISILKRRTTRKAGEEEDKKQRVLFET